MVEWFKKIKGDDEEIWLGAGKEFTKITDAIVYAHNTGNCDIYVDRGTYDIVSAKIKRPSGSVLHTSTNRPYFCHLIH